MGWRNHLLKVKTLVGRKYYLRRRRLEFTMVEQLARRIVELRTEYEAQPKGNGHLLVEAESLLSERYVLMREGEAAWRRSWSA
jgi:hypothetical protein